MFDVMAAFHRSGRRRSRVVDRQMGRAQLQTLQTCNVAMCSMNHAGLHVSGQACGRMARIRAPMHLEIDSVRVRAGLTPTPASEGQLPPVAQARRSGVVSLMVLVEDAGRDHDTSCSNSAISTGEPPSVLMSPDGAHRQ